MQELLAGDVKETFGSWDTDANLFDKKVGKKLRKYATKLYSIQPRATGAVSDAIAAEAKALTDISIAIDLEDDSQIGSASNAANSSLAQVRGVCNF